MHTLGKASKYIRDAIRKRWEKAKGYNLGIGSRCMSIEVGRYNNNTRKTFSGPE